ncbi:hypothetical protein CDAR_99121 [Caerostris darwini]|uniref:Uncharacterized protein n=1 Tax=Caerostris darwini TaxID=1538125 RepID=A0AAV4Q0R9_9ARAC|nr:hypothetical protein CDAR_99121 [Caerostris darwini]
MLGVSGYFRLQNKLDKICIKKWFVAARQSQHSRSDFFQEPIMGLMERRDGRFPPGIMGDASKVTEDTSGFDGTKQHVANV